MINFTKTFLYSAITAPNLCDNLSHLNIDKSFKNMTTSIKIDCDFGHRERRSCNTPVNYSEVGWKLINVAQKCKDFVPLTSATHYCHVHVHEGVSSGGRISNCKIYWHENKFGNSIIKRSSRGPATIPLLIIIRIIRCQLDDPYDTPQQQNIRVLI